MFVSVKMHVLSVSCSLNSDFFIKNFISNISYPELSPIIPCALLFHTL